MILAQVDPTTAVANGLASNPLAWGLAIALATIGYLFKELRAEQKARAESERANADRVIATFKEVLPLAQKLTECVELVDKAIDRLSDGD